MGPLRKTAEFGSAHSGNPEGELIEYNEDLILNSVDLKKQVYF